MSAKIFLSLISVGVFTGALFAQQATESVPMDLEARKASVVTLRRHIEQRQARLSDLAKDIISLDQRVETRIDGIVKMLSEIKDSNESRTKVARTKEEAIEGLKRTIDAYVRKRSEIREQLRTSGSEANREVLASDVKKFDDRISKRVDQIVELSKSFTQHEDVKKYEDAGGGGYGWGGWYQDDTRISDDWKQNRRQATFTDKEKEDLVKAIKESLESLKARQAVAVSKLKENNLGEAQKDFYQAEKEDTSRLLAQREKQLVSLIRPEAQPNTKAIGQDEAYNLDRLLDDERKDLADDFSSILRKYSELANERTRIKQMEDNLKAREEWLAKNSKE